MREEEAYFGPQSLQTPTREMRLMRVKEIINLLENNGIFLSNRSKKYHHFTKDDKWIPFTLENHDVRKFPICSLNTTSYVKEPTAVIGWRKRNGDWAWKDNNINDVKSYISYVKELQWTPWGESNRTFLDIYQLKDNEVLTLIDKFNSFVTS